MSQAAAGRKTQAASGSRPPPRRAAFLPAAGCVDTHVHLASSRLPNAWADGDLNADCARAHPGRAVAVARAAGDLTEARLAEDVAAAAAAGDDDDSDALPRPVRITRAVFVECFNAPPLEEARWALEKAAAADSMIVGVVAHAPAFQGGAAVEAFLAGLKDPQSGALPAALKGARQVMLLPEYSAEDYCTSNADFAGGLAALAAAGLHWEWCCHYKALPHVAQVCAATPNMTFVLDHLGRNNGTEEDVAEWAAALALVAANPNVVAKIGAIEEWGVADPAPLLDVAVKLFGFERLMFESNWFVSKACGYAFGELIAVAQRACLRNGASAADVDAVFRRNAERVYRLS